MFLLPKLISVYYLSVLCVLTLSIASGRTKELSSDEIKIIASTNDHNHFEKTLKKVIQPRIVGTPGHEVIKNYIINELKAFNFDVELDAFQERVPYFNNVTFTNIVGRLNPNAKQYLALACHYDSKYFPGEIFYGAIDSAVPCAIMLNLLKTLQPALDKLQNRNDISLMLIFFDGEEAFKDWTRTDSLYGSRHLANKWSVTRKGTTNTRLIDQIEALVLIDLIGGRNPLFYSFYENTDGLHDRLVKIERHLHQAKLLPSRNYMFLPQSNFASIDDDHRPFLEQDVPVLHVIPVPFPNVWHKITDNMENLHMPSIKNFITIFRVFTLDYLMTHQSSTNFRIR